jgi:hypothetical protein
MKKKLKLAGVITMVAIIGLGITACDFLLADEDDNGIGGDGSSGSPFTVRSETGWNEVRSIIRNGGNDKEYTINITGDFSVPGSSGFSHDLTFGRVSGVTITLLGNNNTISLRSQGILLDIVSGQTIIIKDLTLRGFAANNRAVVNNGGNFYMQGNSSIRDNIGGPGVVSTGGSSPTFIMQDNASITNNSSTFGIGGGGVYLGGGTFIMQDNASISNNITSGNGGGVCVVGATFTMLGGRIFGNKANGNGNWDGGGGVFLSTIGGPTFNKTGGVIYGSGENANSNTTPRRGQAIYQAGFLAPSTFWRNATAGKNDNTTNNDFWLND